MRYATYFALVVAALALIGLSVANRHVVTLRGWPDLTEYGVAGPPVYEIPLFAPLIGAGLVGFLLGLLREYLREARYRRGLNERVREIGELKREISRLRGAQKQDADDEIIALTSR